MLGPATTVTVLVAWDELDAASFTDQSMVRLPAEVLVVLNLIDFERGLILQESCGAAQGQRAAAV